MTSKISKEPYGHNKDLIEPELHVLGEIVGGSGFDSDNSFCFYELKTGDHWTLVGGEAKGQSQIDFPRGSMHVWNHPLDLHFYTKTMQGWPRIILAVHNQDSYGGNQLIGYGFFFIPMTGGHHTLEVPIWRPQGTPSEEIYDFFLGALKISDAPCLTSADISTGGVPQFNKTDVISSALMAKGHFHFLP
jgi:B9 domain-containing protein 2